MAASSDRIDAYVWRISGVVMIGAIMSILDTTIVNVALATMSHELHSTISQIQWVVTGYMLSLAAVIPVSGWAAQKFGAKPVYMTALVLFTLGSALCGLANSTTTLILFRVIQGAGGGMILPVGQLMMAEAAGPSRMGRVMSIVVIPAMLAPILGPTLGGLIIANSSWRWIFYINVPIGVIGVIAAARLLPYGARGTAPKLDVTGLVLMTMGLVLSTYGLAEIGSTGGVSSAHVLVPLLSGVALVTAFCVRALRIPRPLLDLRLYRKPTYSAAAFAMFCLSAAMFGGQILLPLYWQDLRHLSVVDTGLLVAPQGVGAGLVMPIAGRLTDRIGGGPLALFGVILTAIATIPLLLLSPHTSIVWLCFVLVIRGCGIGFGFMPTWAAAFASLDRSELPDATPQLNVVQRVGGSIGVAVVAVVLQRGLAGAHTPAAMASAYSTAFWASLVMIVLAIAPCLVLLRAERAARRAAAHDAVRQPLVEEPIAA